MGIKDRIGQWLKGQSAADSAALFFGSLPTVETGRLILRKARTGDAEDIFAYSKDPEVARHVLWSAHRSLGDSRAYIRYLHSQYREGQPGSYVIVRKPEGRVIGTAGWMEFNPDHRWAEVGYSLARDCWNQGYMTEALQELLRLSFTELELNRVIGRYELDNPASRRVMEKCGMRLEGIMRQAVLNKGRFSDVGQCAILREEWEQLQRR